MVCTNICECVNTVHKLTCCISIVNQYACNAIACIRSDCERLVSTFVNRYSSVRIDSTTVSCSCSDCVCVRSFIGFESCLDCMVCINILECVSCNRTYALSVNQYVCNVITTVGCYCKCLVYTFFNSYCSVRSDSTTVSCTCCDCVGVRSISLESCFDCMVCHYIRENVACKRAYALSVNQYVCNVITSAGCYCKCLVCTFFNSYCSVRSDSTTVSCTCCDCVGDSCIGNSYRNIFCWHCARNYCLTSSVMRNYW